MDSRPVAYARPLSGHRADIARWLDRGLAALGLSPPVRGAPCGDTDCMRGTSHAQRPHYTATILGFAYAGVRNEDCEAIRAERWSERWRGRARQPGDRGTEVGARIL